MTLYKYMPLDRLEKIFRSDGVWLKLSSPSEFNDPFDSTGQVVGMPSKSFVRHYAQNRTDLLKRCRGDLAEMSEIVRDDFSLLMGTRTQFDDFLRILCVSDAPSAAEPLMWSHYACNASGARIAIDFSDCNVCPVPINYCFSAPFLDVGRAKWFNGDDSAISSFCLTCVFSKNIAWSYEREWRVMFKIDSIDDLKAHGIEVVCKNGIYFWLPPQSAVKGIDFGSQAKGIDSIVKRIAANGYVNIEINVAKKNYNSYGYTYEPYKN